ncbi:hypothetical protein DFJ58DRAFT_714447 [Suillus subalutaceus]|uniref:uncharacterized protein n=1 Tax=Suillus subalutaceus TaxID=48586 RepID=UPI001B85E815|nr:uncharacterized protein DFJ58DRAFT_714447 [Suillus subalutaceus]KAG1867209.1 hypothetical protein DFJ58DRAFT_714447 [Suillus subalutaceus]
MMVTLWLQELVGDVVHGGFRASRGNWSKAALQVAHQLEKGEWFTHCLCQWTKAYIRDRKNLPLCQKSHAISHIEDEELAADIKLHLQSVGKYIRALNIVHYLDDPIVQKCHGFKNTISLKTAQRWLWKLDYWWKKEKRGQYSDGHERDDVVYYCQNIFLPAWESTEARLRTWKQDDLTCEDSPPLPELSRRIVAWFHNESTFYANDRHKVRWEHKDEDALPQPKGEGVSLMVAHFVSADYGFLQSPDGKETAQVLFKAGKSRDGYYSSNDILKHAVRAMDILEKYYPNEDHILIFDNAMTHPMMGSDGKPLKKKIPMAPAYLRHPQAGWFKGTEKILQERGYNTKGLLAECKGFKCKAGKKDCCCRQILFNELDFANVKVYRLNPPSSKEADLEQNVVAALASIPLLTMQRFINAYKEGLDGKYHGHQVLPEGLLINLEKATNLSSESTSVDSS